MKLKSILGVCVATAAMTASCFNCFAADEAITYGAPIDLATAQEVSGDIVAGTHIAVPVELSNSDGRTTSFAAKVLYDDEYVTPGATTSTDKKIGSINLTMDGTVTSYTTVDGTIAK